MTGYRGIAAVLRLMICRLAVFAVLALSASAASAQSPFESAPAPAAPPVRPRPAPAPRRQPSEELQPTVTTPPVAPAVAPQPPPPPPEPSLAGIWHFWSNCPLDPGSDLTLTPSGPGQYRISGTAGLLPVAVSGWVSGKLVHMEANPPLNHIVSEGTVDSPTAMSGKTTPAIGFACEWSGRKK
jgi:hypothetical protein